MERSLTESLEARRKRPGVSPFFFPSPLNEYSLTVYLMFGNVRLFRNILYTMGEMGLMDSVSIDYRILQLSINLTG